MKRLMTLIVASTFALAPLSAQSNAKAKKKNNLGEKVTRIWEQVKKDINDTADRIFTKDTSDLRKIDNAYYMPLYSVNLYNGTEEQTLRDDCRSMFVKKYPQASIMSCVLPQQTWISKPIYENGKITGYVQTMHCYIIARDGADGYINSKFTFVRAKQVGKTYRRDDNRWPEWERTDVLTNSVYDKLNR